MSKALKARKPTRTLFRLQGIRNMVTSKPAISSTTIRELSFSPKIPSASLLAQTATPVKATRKNVPRIEQWAKQVLAYVEEGDMLRTQLAGVKKFARYQPIDAIGLRRNIGDRIIERENYPF